MDVIVGGGYGSEGKGNIAFYLAPEYDLLIRVGGPTLPTRSTSRPVRSSPTSACRQEPRPGRPSSPSARSCRLPARTPVGDRPMRRHRRPPVDRSPCDDHRGLRQGRRSGPRRLDRLDCVRDRHRHRPPALRGETFASPVTSRPASIHPANVRDPGARLRGRKSDHARGHPRQRAVATPRALPLVTSRDTNIAGCLAESGIAPARVRKVV